MIWFFDTISEKTQQANTNSNYYLLRMPNGEELINNKNESDSKYITKQVFKCIKEQKHGGFTTSFGDPENKQSILIPCKVIQNSIFVFSDNLLKEVEE